MEVTVGGSDVYGMAYLRHFNGIGDTSSLINKILLRLHALDTDCCLLLPHLCIVTVDEQFFFMTTNVVFNSRKLPRQCQEL